MNGLRMGLWGRLYVMLLVYLFTLQMASSNVPTVATSVVGLNG